METSGFLQTHRVFSLDEAVRALDPAGGRKAVLERLKYAARRGKVKPLARGVYASIPPDADPAAFRPDPFLAAAALRPDAVFSHHSALELLGAAHSLWRRCTAFSTRRPRHFTLDGMELHFLSYPEALIRQGLTDLGTRSVRRFDRDLRVTGPERTLIDGFRQPDRAGGLAELVESAAGFSVLELPLLFELLHAYRRKVLWAAVGWFLETYRETFFVGEADLARIESHVPKAPQYLARDQRGGVLLRRWNLIVPDPLVTGGTDESER
ncbi:MAG: hypothetical protein U5K33_07075 [Halofilum sp. (in: g-proteobacteria)]|nr:hypothetical protein [Halofilum sp. (in: g-proteobacteria)]